MISNIIKARLVENKVRHFACDNVSEYIQPGEMEQLVEEVTGKFEEVLQALLIDTENDPNSQATAKRLSKMYIKELLSGRYYPAPEATAFPNEQNYNGMLVVRSEIRSQCSHHWQNVNGVCYIGVIPGKKVIGLSKYSRIAQWCARRGTLQEELCDQIASAIMAATETDDVGIYIEAKHGCCEQRGIMAASSLTQTTVLHGKFQKQDVKQEFIQNVQLQKMSPSLAV